MSDDRWQARPHDAGPARAAWPSGPCAARLAPRRRTGTVRRGENNSGAGPAAGPHPDARPRPPSTRIDGVTMSTPPTAAEPTPFDDGELYDTFCQGLTYGIDFYAGLARAAAGPV